MLSHHYLMLLIAVIAGIALQKYLGVWQRVGLPG